MAWRSRRLLSGACYALWAFAAISTLACGGGGGSGDSSGGNLTDTTPPSIGSVAISPRLLTVGAEVHLRVEVTDEQSGVQAVSALITYPDNSQASVALQASGNRTTYASAFTAQWTLSSVSQARIVVQAVDKAGNRSSREQSVRTVAAPPAPPF